MTDPKRCPTCRAARQGVVGIELTCQRCHKSFIYPSELQLYARSYGWDAPTTCLGGCGEKKYSQDYQLSEFENLATTILGSLSKFLRGKPRDKPEYSNIDSISQVRGFQDTRFISNSDVKKFLDEYIPSNHQKQFKSIRFSGKKMQILNTDTYSRGYFDADKSIVVNKDPLGLKIKARIKDVIAHEIGHAVYFSLSDEVKADWYTLSEDAGALSESTKIIWNKEEELREAENFSEAYRLYILNPDRLLLQSYKIYYFIQDQIFNGKEYI